MLSNSKNAPHILLITPWIHDFSAYDYWAKSLGLLILAAILRDHGVRVFYIDCLDRFHPQSQVPKISGADGRGAYLKTRIPKPSGMESIPRNYCRYGILPEWFSADLHACSRPDLILVTSQMTYWYPGVQETIREIRAVFPEVPVILGGIYASLCPEHARIHSGADEVVSGDGFRQILALVEKHTGFSPAPVFDPANMDTLPFPALDIQHHIPYAPLLTSRGCPFSCAYCASSLLDPVRMKRSPEGVMEEIRYWHEKYGVRDFAFYDDALLVEAESHALPLFESIVRSGLDIRLHTPNAVHIREINLETASLMYRAGVGTLRLGLETTAFEKRRSLDRKVTEGEFKQAVACLKKAGFPKDRVGAYLLVGLPGQSFEAVEASIRAVKEAEITPVPAYYTPIPKTALWKEAVASSCYDLESDPVFTNNAIFPCLPGGFSWEWVTRIKNLIKG